jgi:divalent metal cation (Fe/Co/Zn/Cd) transporter
VVVSIFILHAAIRITWPSLKELIDAGAPAEIRAQIRTIAGENKAVMQVHDIRTRYIGSSLQVVLHIVVDGTLSVRAGHDLAKDVEHRLIRNIPEVVEVVVHVDPPEGAVPDGRRN